MSKTRGIRLSTYEEQLIEEFLGRNPFFDFSTLARTAILAFVKDPKMTFHPVKESQKKEQRRRASGRN